MGTNQENAKNAIEEPQIATIKTNPFINRRMRKKTKEVKMNEKKAVNNSVTRTKLKGKKRKERSRKLKRGKRPVSNKYKYGSMKNQAHRSPKPNCDVCKKSKKNKDCWCVGFETPGQIPNRKTPKLIMVTFDDAVTSASYVLYEELFDGRTNPNGCPVATTLFVSDLATNYDHVKDLYRKGHEIAVHTVSHRTPLNFWRNAKRRELIKEIVGMKKKLEKAGIKNVVGYRNPFLQTAGDRTFSILHKYGFVYDSTLPVSHGKLYWPFTLDNGFPLNCVISPCPSRRYPGFWEVPMLQLKDITATCSMFDACHRFSSNTPDGVFEFFKTNFDRHYETSMAPFPLFAHAAWMMHPAFDFRKQGFIRFLDYLESRDDVYLVNIQQVIDWMRSPTPLADIKKDSGPLSCPGL
ncbi:chitin deacetylase 8-like [Clytia hemisphaerica]|uniref:chitin deacetylase 8-like n=1 Tax=Clytia hemisphaerica TaxID=252671 RepID=UPI0034D46E73